MLDPKISDNRRDYGGRPLLESEVDPDPIAQFRVWFEEAVEAGLRDPTAMNLATANQAGKPSGRIVLMKDFDASGFVFFTNTDSRKGREMEENPWVALTFYWAELDRQVRIEGAASLLSGEESDAYFATRPRASQLSTWISKQSGFLESRGVLEKEMEALMEKVGQGPVPRPEAFCGYRVRPASIEFWQGQPSRLHDRLLYTRTAGGWRISRLYP